MTKRMFLDLRMVMRVTPWICRSPSLDMAWGHTHRGDLMSHHPRAAKEGGSNPPQQHPNPLGQEQTQGWGTALSPTAARLSLPRQDRGPHITPLPTMTWRPPKWGLAPQHLKASPPPIPGMGRDPPVPWLTPSIPSHLPGLLLTPALLCLADRLLPGAQRVGELRLPESSG